MNRDVHELVMSPPKSQTPKNNDGSSTFRQGNQEDFDEGGNPTATTPLQQN